MSNVGELIRRAERLRDQAEMLREEIDELRQELLRLGTEPNGAQSTLPPEKPGCLGVAITLAQDLGPEFSSEHPHDVAERGADWSIES